MKTLGLNPKKLILALCILVVGIFGLALFVLTLVYPIQEMKVYVEVPTNAPPWVLAAAATNKSMMQAATNEWTTDVPFDDATNKFVSETDIAQIKQAIPRHKTILHLYVPKEIVVESPTKAYAEFSRRHMGVRVRLVKEDKTWHADDVQSFKWELAGPPNWRQQMAESLPR